MNERIKESKGICNGHVPGSQMCLLCLPASLLTATSRSFSHSFSHSVLPLFYQPLSCHSSKSSLWAPSKLPLFSFEARHYFLEPVRPQFIMWPLPQRPFHPTNMHLPSWYKDLDFNPAISFFFPDHFVMWVNSNDDIRMPWCVPCSAGLESYTHFINSPLGCAGSWIPQMSGCQLK